MKPTALRTLIKQKVNLTFVQTSGGGGVGGTTGENAEILYRRSVSVQNGLICISLGQYVVLPLGLVWIISN